MNALSEHSLLSFNLMIYNFEYSTFLKTLRFSLELHAKSSCYLIQLAFVIHWISCGTKEPLIISVPKFANISCPYMYVVGRNLMWIGGGHNMLNALPATVANWLKNWCRIFGRLLYEKMAKEKTINCSQTFSKDKNNVHNP